MNLDSVIDALRDVGRDVKGVLGRGAGYGMQNIQNALPEALRNYAKTSEWLEKKQAQDLYGGDFEAQERADKMMGFGTDAGGLVGAIKASHGSPHMFDRFRMDKIGTGEGAQAYGHGMYFAQGFDSPVAKEYRDQLAADVQLKGQPFYSGKSGKQMATTGNQELDDYLLANLGDVSAARSNLLADLRDVRSGGGDVKGYQKTLADLRNIRGDVESGNTGHLYNVELKWPDAAREAADPLGEHHLLDWDAPLSEQSPFVKEALNKAITLLPEQNQELFKDYPLQDFQLGKDLKDMIGERYMAQAGIPGIRYLDQASRNAGTGSRNYVMFDDQFPEIITRNGQAIAKALREK